MILRTLVFRDETKGKLNFVLCIENKDADDLEKRDQRSIVEACLRRKNKGYLGEPK